MLSTPQEGCTMWFLVPRDGIGRKSNLIWIPGQDAIKKSGFYITTVEQIRHNYTESNRFTTLDLNFAFHQ